MIRQTRGGQGQWPGVSVIIPVRDEAEALRGALRSVASQRYPGAIEIIVADGSDDAAPVLAATRGFPGVRVIRNPGRNAAAGLNIAVLAASHPVAARCDARCALPPGYLRRAVETLLRTKAANVGGRQVPVGTTAFQRAVAMAMASPLGSGGARYRRGGPEGSVDTVFLGVFRRDAVLGCGNFDASFERNQDYELNWRLRRAGGIVWFDPELAVPYRPRRTLAALARQYFDYGRWKRAMLRRWPRSLRLRQLLPTLLTLGLLSSAVLGLAGALRDWPDAVAAAAFAPTAYVAALLAATAASLTRHRQAAALLLPAVLATMHLAWGAGFLVGRGPGRAGAQSAACPEAPGSVGRQPGAERSSALNPRR